MMIKFMFLPVLALVAIICGVVLLSGIKALRTVAPNETDGVIKFAVVWALGGIALVGVMYATWMFFIVMLLQRIQGG